jgi:voltage-gated sodium channel
VEQDWPENCFNQTAVRRAYDSPGVQIAVASLIFANFMVSAVQAQVAPTSTDPPDWFVACEWFFGMIFLGELTWNMYGSWFGLFWQSGWNWFDFFIVLISLVSLSDVDLPGISVLRVFRAFRVFRLFKRVGPLKLIINGVFASLPGIFNAFLVLGIIMAIWSIMGVMVSVFQVK